MKRKLTIAVVFALATVAVAGLVLRSYLRSHRVAQQITTRLEALYGGPVRVANVNVGLGSTTLNGFELLEQEGSDQAPWLKVASLTIDVSRWDMAGGDALPHRITLKDSILLLRFNRDGDLITHFPAQTPGGEPRAVRAGSIPDAVLENSQVIFRKEGHADLVVTKVNATLSHKEGRLILSGSGDSAEFGKLSLDGSLAKDSELVTAHVTTDRKVYVTQADLERLPFVPAEVWDQVRIAKGETSATLELTYDLKEKSLGYRVELAPEHTEIAVPAVDLQAHNVSGKITIEDRRVGLRDVKGQAFGGQVSTEADLDFRGPVSKLTFKTIQVADVNVDELTEEWNIPAFIRKSVHNGKLSGTAAMKVSISSVPPSPAQVSTLCALLMAPPGLGSGQWFSAVAELSTFPTYLIQTSSKGKAEVRDPAGKMEPIQFDWQFAPRRVRSTPPVAKISGATLDTKVLLATLLANQILLLHNGLPEGAQSEVSVQEGKDPKYLDVNFNLKNVSLADLIKNFDLKFPLSLDGKASIQIKAAVPLERPDTLKAYRGTGSVQVTDFVLAGIKLDEVTADFTLDNGVLYLKSLKGRIEPDKAGKAAAGTLHGTGQIELDPPGELRADLQLDQIPLAKLANLDNDKLQGTASGTIILRGLADKLTSFAGIQAEGKIHSERLTIYGLTLEKASSTVALKDGILKLPNLQGRLEGKPVSATAELRLDADNAFSAKMDLRDWSLATLQKLAGLDKDAVIPLSGAFTTSVILEGKFSPFQFKTSGDASAENIKIDAFEAQKVLFHWETDGKKLDLKDVDVLLYGGKATGTALVPIDAKMAGNFDVRMHDLEAKKFAKALRVPFSMDGKIDGTLKGILPPVENNQARTAKLNLDLKAAKMRVQNIPTEKLQGALEYQNGVLDYKLEGKTLGGSFELEGQIPSRAKPNGAKKEAKKGRLRIHDVKIGRLLQSLDVPNTESVKGILNVEVQYTHDTVDGNPDGRGTVRISNFRWKDTVLANNLQGDIFLSAQRVRLRAVQGSIAQGTIDAQLTYFPRQPERSSFTVNLERVEAGHLLAPWLEEKIEGTFQAHIRGNLGSPWRGSADLELARGKVFGLDVTQWRLPVVWSYAPGQNRGQLDIAETTAQVGHGRLTGKLSYAWDATTRLEGSLRLVNADLQDLLRQTVGPSQIGAGKTTAKFDFAGNDVRSLKDINGTLVASFNQAQALQVPVLTQIAPYLGVGTSTTFQKGELRARLDRGTFRIQEFALKGNNLQLHVTGTVSLEERLNLEVVARSGDLVPTARLGGVALRIPVGGPIPVALLLEASNLLSRRIVNLHVTGTPRSPVIQIRPLAILSQEAVRFFLDRSNLPITLDP